MREKVGSVLLLVESPKLAPVARGLVARALRTDVSVIATRGHLFDLPERAEADGLDPHWEPIDPRVITRVKDAAAAAACVLVATDPDDEGERIAFQAKSILSAPCFRLRVTSWTVAGVATGLSSESGFNEPIARAAESRRIIDRIIGWRFKTPGRVRAQLLSGWLREAPPATWPAPEVDAPPDLGALLMAASRIRIKIESAATQMAEAWLDGRCSYPRTDGRQYSTESLKIARRIANELGYLVHPAGPLPGREGSHEALLPTGRERTDGVLLGVLRNVVAASMARRPAAVFCDTSLDKKIPLDARLLIVARRDGVGRPGTWASHIRGLETTGFLHHGDVDCERARRALAKLPQTMLLPETPVRFESALREVGLARANVQDALAIVGIDAAVKQRWSWGEQIATHAPVMDSIAEVGT